LVWDWLHYGIDDYTYCGAIVVIMLDILATIIIGFSIPVILAKIDNPRKYPEEFAINP